MKTKGYRICSALTGKSLLLSVTFDDNIEISDDVFNIFAIHNTSQAYINVIHDISEMWLEKSGDDECYYTQETEDYFNILASSESITLHPYCFKRICSYLYVLCSLKWKNSMYYIFLNQEWIYMMKDDSPNAISFINKMGLEDVCYTKGFFEIL